MTTCAEPLRDPTWLAQDIPRVRLGTRAWRTRERGVLTEVGLEAPVSLGSGPQPVIPVRRSSKRVAVMATLQQADRIVVLEAYTVVGRAAGHGLRVVDPCVSTTHASIRWTGVGWELQDLDSTNGTFCNGERLLSREKRGLAVNDRLAFGRERSPWTVVSLDPPQAMAVADDGTVALAEHGVIAIPAADQLEITLYQDERGHWVSDGEGTVSRVVDRQILSVAGQRWRFCCPEAVGQTELVVSGRRSAELAAMALHFTVSPDEEHVEVAVMVDDRVELLESRACHYLLLTLARARIHEPGKAAPPADQEGWVSHDELCRCLAFDDQRLNTDIFRLRQAFARIGAVDYARIVERRTRPRRLRTGALRIQITRRQL